MKFEAKQIPEGINTSNDHPLRELIILLSGVAALLLVAFVVLMLMSDFLVRFIPLQTEQQWFSSSRLDFVSKAEPTPDGANVERYLGELVAKLKPAKDKDIQYTIRLMDSDIPNAFITPGGHIFVTTELLRHVNTENALAMVIAHEMAHQVHRHPIRGMGRGIVIAVALMMLTGVDGSEWVLDIFAESINLGLLAYSREQEREADQTGIKMLIDRYGHSAGSSYFFEQLVKLNLDQLNGVSEYMSTHPDTDERIAFLKTYESPGARKQVPLPAAIERLLNRKQRDDK